MGDREEEWQRKPRLTRGDHRLAQVLVRPEVFSIHMKWLKIRALGSSVALAEHNKPEILYSIQCTLDTASNSRTLASNWQNTSSPTQNTTMTSLCWSKNTYHLWHTVFLHINIKCSLNLRYIQYRFLLVFNILPLVYCYTVVHKHLFTAHFLQKFLRKPK